MATLIEFTDEGNVPREVSNHDPLPVTTSISGRFVSKTITLTGGANLGKSGDTSPLFTVTGTVLMKLYSVGKPTPVSAGGGKLEVGVTGNTAAIIAQTTATSIVAGDIWKDGTPVVGVTASSGVAENIVTASVGMKASTADVTAGAIYFYCFWIPLSADGSVVAA